MNLILLKRLHIGCLMAVMLTASIGWGQGFEDFTNLNAPTGSFGSGSFIGNNGVKWTYVKGQQSARTGLDLPALALAKKADDGNIKSGSIPNGIRNFSVKLYKSNPLLTPRDQQVELFVNNVSQGLSVVFDDANAHVFEVNNINITGNVVIQIKNNLGGAIILDDITWTSYPGPFEVPYSNGLRNQIDVDEALSYEFEFNNATLTTPNGGGIEIINGSIVSPAIDFSAHDKITVVFNMTTLGGNTGQQLTLSVSNDNGANYTSLGTFITPPSSQTFVQLVDLTSLNGTQGRIKFEMTAGTNSIRFRDLSLQEFGGYFYSGGAWNPNDPSGVSTASTDIYVADGVAQLTANTTARNVTVNTGATLEVQKVLTIAGDITNVGNLVFVSNASGNGELGKVPSGSTIRGKATVQRYMRDKRTYRMVSSAVTTTNSIHANWQEGATSNTHNPNLGFGTHITGSKTDQQNGFDGTVGGASSMFTVDVPNQQFIAVTDTDVNTLTAGRAYLLYVRGDRSIDLFNNSSFSATTLRATGSLVSGTNTQNFATEEAGNIVMFGNPYQSTVDVNKVIANSTNINDEHYFVYDPNIGDYGGYVTVVLPGGSNTSSSAANQFLQPGQAAQVETLGVGASVVVFNEDDKDPGHFTSSNRSPMFANDMLTVQLYTTENFNNGGPVHDSFGILFGAGNDNGITSTDAIKPMNFGENLAIDHNGTYLSLESRELPHAAEVYPLYIAGYKHMDYTLKIAIDGLEDAMLYLNDQFTGTRTFLEVGENSYSFSVDANDALSIATDRFSIHTGQRLGVDNSELLSGIQLFPNPLNGDTFYINAPRMNGEQLMVKINDLTGRKIYGQTLGCNANTVTVPMGKDIASGVYLVTLEHGGEAQIYRLIKK